MRGQGSLGYHSKQWVTGIFSVKKWWAFFLCSVLIPPPFPADAQLVLWAVLEPMTDLAASYKKPTWPVFPLAQRLHTQWLCHWDLNSEPVFLREAAVNFLPESDLVPMPLLALCPLLVHSWRSQKINGDQLVVCAEPHSPYALEPGKFRSLTP